jgi:hypothetical protein
VPNGGKKPQNNYPAMTEHESLVMMEGSWTLGSSAIGQVTSRYSAFWNFGSNDMRLSSLYT